MEEPPKILSYNHVTNTTEYKNIVAKKKKESDDIIEVLTVNKKCLVSTASHRYYVKDNGYIEGSKLNVLNELVTLSGKDYVRNIEKVNKSKVTVYDIQVEGNHNFFANNVLVHNCIIVDDPHNPKNAESDAERNSALDFFKMTLPSRLNDKRNGVIIVIMQRLHEEDISGYILSKDLGYTHLCLPAEAEEKMVIHFPISNKEIIRKPGDVLNPKREPKDVLEQLKKDMGSYAYSGQYQQNPVPTGGGVFKKWWWRYWKPKGIKLPPVRVKGENGEYILIEAEDLPDDMEETAQSWDLTFKNNKDNDYVAGEVWGRKGANRYMIDLVKDRLEFTETLDAIRKLTKQYPQAKRKLVEDKANGPAVMSMLKSELGGLIPINPGSDSKESRAFAITPIVESGNVYLPHPLLKTWVDDFIEDCAKFPKVAHDDTIDAMTQMLNYWSKKRKVRVARIG